MNTISYEKPSKKMPVSNAGFVTEVETNDRYTAMNGENAGNDAEWIKVNMLPTRTWNRLKVNESYVKTPEIKSFCRCEMTGQGCSPSGPVLPAFHSLWTNSWACAACAESRQGAWNLSYGRTHSLSPRR